MNTIIKHILYKIIKVYRFFNVIIMLIELVLLLSYFERVMGISSQQIADLHMLYKHNK